MMNQGLYLLIIFVVSLSFTQEELNGKLESDNSIPIAGGNLTLSCLMSDFFKDDTIHWFNPKGTVLSRCHALNGECWPSDTSSYSFTANISGAYAYINGLDRARDGGTWTCKLCDRQSRKTYAKEIVIFTSPSGVHLVQPIQQDGDLGVESITLMCQTVACTFPAPNITWYYKTNSQNAPFIGFPGYTPTRTTECPQREAIYTSTLHLPRGTNFSGNIPLTTKFRCGITHQSLGDEMLYSHVSNDVIFAVQVSKVNLVGSESGTIVGYEGFPQTLKCISSPARPVPIIQWFLKTNNATNATTFTANITEMNTTNNDGLHVTESEITIIPSRDQIYTIHCAGNIYGQQAIIDIDILYAPGISVTVTGPDQLNMTLNVTCEASGFPTNYTFHPWKQMFGEVTIRSNLQGNLEGIINSSKNTLTLNRLSLQDIGTYVCAVDNGVRGVNGAIIQTSATVLNVKGTSLLLNMTNAKFTGEIGSSVNICVAFYSDPVITNFKFQRHGLKVENTSRTYIYLSTNVVEVLFYNKNVNLTVSMAHLLIKNLTEDDFDDYNLVLENFLGKTYFKVHLHLSDKNHSHANTLVAAVVGIIVTAIVVILGVSATRILMTTRIFATKKSNGAYQSRRPMSSLRDDIVRKFEADVQDDAETVYENRNDVDLVLLRNNGALIYADLELAIIDQNNGKPIIHGLENRTEYAEIEFDKRGEPLPDSDNENESLGTN